LHLDLDVYNPTSFALNSLFKYVTPGGIILLDDYKSIKGATIAINEFVREKYSIFNLEIKLLKRVLKILEELEKSEFKEKFYTKIDNLIFKKQIEFLTIFYGKIFA